MEEKKEFTTELSVWTNSLNELVSRDFEENGVEYDEYSRQCGMNAMTNIYSLVKSSGESISNIDTSNLRQIVADTASLKLNPNGYPKECFYSLSTKKVGNTFVKVVEMQPQGAGYESLLRNWGIGVEKVYPTWVVNEGDTFIYPKHKGVEVTPPEWEQKGLSQKAIRVVVPVKLTDGNYQYLIAEREGVKVNLKAHVIHNLLSETFGICENRYKATEEQKAKIKSEKQKILDALDKCETLDEMLNCEVAKPYFLPSWVNSTESMIIRKMINNAVRPFPKNYSTLANRSLVNLDESYKESQSDAEENANTIPFDEETVFETTAKVVEENA